MRRLAALTAAIAVAALWLALYRSPTYPPALGLPLAIAGAFFFCALVFLYRVHAHEFLGIARLGFAISAIGAGVWVAGGTMNGLGVQGTESNSAIGRFMLEVLRGPQAGWGFLCVGLIPIGVAAFITRLSLPMRLLFPVGSLFVLGPPLKYLLGEHAGGIAVLVAFGVGWLAVGVLLLAESINRT